MYVQRVFVSLPRRRCYSGKATERLLCFVVKYIKTLSIIRQFFCGKFIPPETINVT